MDWKVDKENKLWWILIVCAYTLAICGGLILQAREANAGPQDGPVGDTQGLLALSTSGSVVGNAVGTCEDGATLYDINGVQACIKTTDAAPQTIVVSAADAYEFASSNTTGATLKISAGLGAKNLSSITQANCSGDTYTVTVDGSATVRTEGVDWNCLTDDATCCAALAADATAIAGVSATCSGTTVGIAPDSTTSTLSVASSDGTCATANNGTDGSVATYGQLDVVAANGSSTLTTSHDGTYHTITGNDSDGILLGTTGGSFNETLLLDLDSASNTIVLGTTSSASTMDVGFTLNANSLSSDNSISATSYLSAGTASQILFASSTELLAPANGQLQIDQSDNSTGVTLDALTADTLVIKDQAGTGDGALTVGGVTNSLTFDHNGTYHTITGNDVDGILLQTTGGSFNETLLIDFDYGSNFMYFGSTTGVSRFTFNGIVEGATQLLTGGTGKVSFAGRSQMLSPADGQFQLRNAGATSGAVLDIDDVADTVVIKDDAGTGNGNLTVAGTSTLATVVTASGDLDVQPASGALNISDGSGDGILELQDSSAAATCAASTGCLWTESDGTLHFRHGTTGDEVIGGIPTFKSYGISTASSGTHYAAGFYDAPAADANLTEGSPTVTYGTAADARGAHAFVVAAAAGTKDAGTCSLVVSGTSITDAGVRTTSDTETIVADVTAESTNDYSETSKKWLGQITYTLTLAGGATTCSYDFNYGFSKYEDIGNRDFTVTDFECVGEGGATDTGFDIELLDHQATGWTYHATAFVPGNTAIIQLSTDYSTDQRIANGVPFAYKRSGLSESIGGNDSEGIVIRVTTTAVNAVETMDCHLGATLE